MSVIAVFGSILDSKPTLPMATSRNEFTMYLLFLIATVQSLPFRSCFARLATNKTRAKRFGTLSMQSSTVTRAIKNLPIRICPKANHRFKDKLLRIALTKPILNCFFKFSVRTVKVIINDLNIKLTGLQHLFLGILHTNIKIWRRSSIPFNNTSSKLFDRRW